MVMPTLWNSPQVKSLEPGPWRSFFFDPHTGRDIPIPEVAPDASGTWQSPIGFWSSIAPKAERQAWVNCRRAREGSGCCVQ